MLLKSCNIYIDPKPIYYPISTNINFTLLHPINIVYGNIEVKVL